MATLNANGLTIDTLQSIRYNMSIGFQQIFGVDIDLSSSSEGGQMVNVFSQAILDLQNLLQLINSNKDPEQAVGVHLDQICKINNIYRKSGSFTFVDVSIQVDRGVSLQGLDSASNDIDGGGFTVLDSSGQEFVLLNSQNFSSAGTYSCTFRAKKIGRITTTSNSITIPKTIVLGVVAINNPNAQTNIGEPFETDPILRYRRSRSLALNSMASLDAIYSNVINLDNVIDAVVYENDTSTINADGIPPKSVYVVVLGGSNIDVANSIFAHKTIGCGMHGDVSVEISTTQGRTQTIKFDRPQNKSLYISFDIKATHPSQSFNISGIKNYIISNLSYNIGAYAETSSIVEVVKNAISNTGDGGVPLNVKISKDNVSYVDYLDVDLLKEIWVLSSDNIIINVLI
jgi:hypothetical protein